VTESDLVFDTWAWWECLRETPVGSSLWDRFVRHGGYRVHTSAISFGELAARLDSEGSADRIGDVCSSIRRVSHVWDVTPDLAQDAGRQRARLRQSSSSASLADAIVLATAQRAGARIVSADPAFAAIPRTIDR
jgi:predicted nucleic acid-binding protein